MKTGTYNVEHGHPVEPHVDMILSRFNGQHLDSLALTEVADYTAALDAAAKDSGYDLVWIDKALAVKNQALLVRHPHTVRHAWSATVKADYYAPGGAVRHSAAPLCVLADDGLTVVVHAPVTAWTTGHWVGRRFVGPLRRRLAYRKYMLRLVKIAKKHPGIPIRFQGDWNATPDTTGRWSPAWLAKKVGGTIVRPHANTGHGEIDFLIVVNCVGTDCHVVHNVPGRPHSDHLLVVATIKEH